MKFIGYFCFLLGPCVLAVHPTPNVNGNLSAHSSTNSEMKEILKARVHCTRQYKARQVEINNQITLQTIACVYMFNETANSTDEKIAEQIDIIRSNLTSLKDNLSNCTTITDKLAFVQCVQIDNDINMNLLNSAQEHAQHIEFEIRNELAALEDNRKSCMDIVIQKGTRNYTLAGVDYTNCMNRIRGT